MDTFKTVTPLPAAVKDSIIQRAVARLNTRALLTGAILFALFSALFAFVQFGTTALADNDGFYHLRMAALIRQYGLRVPFIWLPLSILNPQAFYDHHLLYHVYLSLFAGGSDQAILIAAKWASVFMPAAAFVAIWWLLRGQQVRYAAIWALGLFAVSEAFLYRMSMPRAQAASLLVLALGLHWLLQRKFVWLIPLGFLYVWLYNAFPLLLVIGRGVCGGGLPHRTALRMESRDLSGRGHRAGVDHQSLLSAEHHLHRQSPRAQDRRAGRQRRQRMVSLRHVGADCRIQRLCAGGLYRSACLRWAGAARSSIGPR